MAPLAAGTRIGWENLPDRVRTAVEAILGGRVEQAVSQSGGFSPGSADRVRTTGGARAFVKAVSIELNADTVELHRREAAVTAQLPASAPVPRLLGVHDDGSWVALVLSDVEGRTPATPWRADEVAAVLASLDALSRSLTPSPVADAPSTAEALRDDFAGWQRIAQEPPPDLDPWVARHLDHLVELAEQALDVLPGDTLVHGDVRADNMLLLADGTVTFVDWPWASRGPAWFDTLLLLINIRLYGGHDVNALLSSSTAAQGADPGDITAVLAGFAGFFLDRARRAPPPGLPSVRAFQREQGDAVVGWLRERVADAPR